jgi:hypothetical protein
MTSQAPCGCVNNILITYDENMAEAHAPTHSLNIYVRHTHHTTAAFEKRIIFFLDLVDQKSLSHTATGIIIIIIIIIDTAQATLYNKK